MSKNIKSKQYLIAQRAFVEAQCENAAIALKNGDPVEAELLYKQALSVAESYGSEGAFVGLVLFGLYDLYDRQNRQDEADIAWERIRVILSKYAEKMADDDSISFYPETVREIQSPAGC